MDDAEQRHEQVALAHSVQPREAEYLPSLKRERNITDAVGGRQFFTCENGFGDGGSSLHLALLLRKDRAQGPADHPFDDFRIRKVIYGVGADGSAVTKNRQRGTEFAHILHPVRDQNDGRSRPFEALDEFAKPLHVAV